MGQYAPDSKGLLAPIQPWLEDSEVSEILLNQPGEIYVEKCGRLQKYKVPEFDQRSVMRLFQLIANENAQEINEKKTITFCEFTGWLASSDRITSDSQISHLIYSAKNR